MSYWELAFGWGWATVDQLRQVVGFGELSKEDFERITGEPFDPVVEPEPEETPVEEEEVVEDIPE